MITTIRRPVTKHCPFVPETDIGELIITIPGDAPELHELGERISQLMGVADTHEAFTRRVAELVPGAQVVTRWHTGPWDVECCEAPEEAAP